jgi:hypothetical protein
MFGSKARRLAADLAFERHRTNLLRKQLAAVTADCASWKRRSQVTSADHADLVIERTRERDDAVRELARIRGGGLFRRIRQAANAAVGTDTYDRPARAVRDFARDLETWLPEDAGDPQPATGEAAP